MLRIGQVELTNRVILAPMAGVTDLPYRKIVAAYRPGLIYGEMISAMALHYQSKLTEQMLIIAPEEHPVSMQLFGSDPKVMAEAARKVADLGADLIDLNLGCPVPKVVKQGEGSALLTNLPLAHEIMKAVVASVSIPVTAKIRLGWNQAQIVAPEVAVMAEEAGIAAIAVHARTREQYYHGVADWSWITRVKQRVKIPVIGNGDVDSPLKAAQMLAETGCDAVMIGRAAMGRPWLFAQVAAYLEEGRLLPDPALATQFEVILKHLELAVSFAGANRGIREMRKHLAWYFKGLPNSARMREKINQLDTLSEVIKALQEYAWELQVELEIAPTLAAI